MNDGLGLEITAVYDDRLLGKLLKVLIDRIAGKVFERSELADTVREVLKSQVDVSGKTFIDEMLCGALGVNEYRKARFLHFIDDVGIVNWVSQFIADWYPGRIQTSDDLFALTHAEHLDLRLRSF